MEVDLVLDYRVLLAYRLLILVRTADLPEYLEQHILLLLVGLGVNDSVSDQTGDEVQIVHLALNEDRLDALGNELHLSEENEVDMPLVLQDLNLQLPILVAGHLLIDQVEHQLHEGVRHRIYPLQQARGLLSPDQFPPCPERNQLNVFL